jgi:DNA-binding IclR family transcriptional regulator
VPDRTARSGVDDKTVIGRTFRLLGAFEGELVLGVRAIARKTGLPLATVHRMVGQLVELDVLSRVGTQFRLGARIFELGTLHYPTELRNALNPFLVDLQRATGADVSTLEMSGPAVVVVDHVPARNSRSVSVKLGARIPAHASAGGRVMMAHSGEIAFQSDDDLLPLTPHTITTVKELKKELARIRADGLAYEHGEVDPATKAVAAPLMNRHGRVLGSLMVSSSRPDFRPEDVAVAVKTLSRTLTRVGANTNISFYARLVPPHDTGE